MANPGKTYNLPCHINIEYGMAAGEFAIFEYVKIGSRKYQMNAYIIEVE